MSTEFLYVMPADPNYVPTADMRDAGLSAFRGMLPRARSVDAVVHTEIRFIDSGMRFEQVLCPLCGSELDQIWWGDAMNIAEKGSFTNLSVRLPCCDAPGSLNHLTYRMPAGFARFTLQAREPGLDKYLTVDRLQALETILGTPLKQVWAHFKSQERGQVRVHRPSASRVALGRR